MTPGHDVNLLFAIVLRHVEGYGLNEHLCIYSNLGSGMEVFTLFAAPVQGLYCGRSCVICAFKDINHREVFKSRGPDKINFCVVKNITVITIKENFEFASHNFGTESRLY